MGVKHMSGEYDQCENIEDKFSAIIGTFSTFLVHPGSPWDPKASQDPSQNAFLAETCVRRSVFLVVLATFPLYLRIFFITSALLKYLFSL